MLFLPWKIMFLYVIFLGTFIALSASSWMMAWMGLEINMLGLLALLMNFKSSRNSEATLKYFLIQALASAILICSAFSGSMVFGFLSSLDLFSNFILMSLLIKLGAAPFHLWVPQVIEGFNWASSSLVLTWQKIAPFILIMFCFEGPNKVSDKIIISSILLSAVLGAIGGLSQSSSRKIIAFSSINHMGWMLIALWNSTFIWSFYFIFYSLILFSLIGLLGNYNISSLSQNLVSMSTLPQSTLYLVLLSFGGLPPFSGFIPKWMVVSSLIESPVILTLLVSSSLLTLFFYIRLAVNSLLQKTMTMAPSFSKDPNSILLSYSLTLNLLGVLSVPALFLI